MAQLRIAPCQQKDYLSKKFREFADSAALVDKDLASQLRWCGAWIERDQRLAITKLTKNLGQLKKSHSRSTKYEPFTAYVTRLLLDSKVSLSYSQMTNVSRHLSLLPRGIEAEQRIKDFADQLDPIEVLGIANIPRASATIHQIFHICKSLQRENALLPLRRRITLRVLAELADMEEKRLRANGRIPKCSLLTVVLDRFQEIGAHINKETARRILSAAFRCACLDSSVLLALNEHNHCMLWGRLHKNEFDVIATYIENDQYFRNCRGLGSLAHRLVAILFEHITGESLNGRLSERRWDHWDEDQRAPLEQNHATVRSNMNISGHNRDPAPMNYVATSGHINAENHAAQGKEIGRSHVQDCSGNSSYNAAATPIPAPSSHPDTQHDCVDGPMVTESVQRQTETHSSSVCPPPDMNLHRYQQASNAPNYITHHSSFSSTSLIGEQGMVPSFDPTFHSGILTDTLFNPAIHASTYGIDPAMDPGKYAHEGFDVDPAIPEVGAGLPPLAKIY